MAFVPRPDLELQIFSVELVWREFVGAQEVDVEAAETQEFDLVLEH